MDGAEIRDLPVGRLLAVDERGVGLRLTWHLDRGFLNLSLWRDDRCVETFHVSPAAAADVIAFLVRGLADATAIGVDATVRELRAVATQHSRSVLDRARGSVAEILERASRVLRP